MGEEGWRKGRKKGQAEDGEARLETSTFPLARVFAVCLLLRLVFGKGSRGDQDKGEWLTSEERRENELWTEGEIYEYYVAGCVRGEKERERE